jgi:hypothetical protein
VYFENLKVLSYKVFFRRDLLNKYIIFSNSKNNRLNNRDFNIDPNNRDYDFSHNRAALPPGEYFGRAPSPPK